MANTIGPMLQQTLQRYGLSSLSPWVSGLLVKGISIDEILFDMYDRPEFKAAFPEIEARRKRAQQQGIALVPLSPDDVLNYRTQAASLMRSRGLPPSFYGQSSDFYDLIVNDVSMDELTKRLDAVETKVVHAPPEVRAAFGELFGANSDTALYSLAVDPDKAQPELEKMLNAAAAGGAGTRFGFNLNADQMNRLADYGVDYSQASQGFAALSEQRGLLDENLAESVDLDLNTGIEATFGLNADSALALKRRAEERSASTGGRAGGAIEDRGATSLGGAGRL